MSEDRFDCVVVGAGPGGRAAAGELAGAGRRVAVVESELVGGECPFWACIPTKALLRPVEAREGARHTPGVGAGALDWPEARERRDYMNSGLDDTKKAKALEDKGIEVVRGAGRLDGPGVVRADGRALRTEHVILATGTSAAIPPVEGLERDGVWTNREATSLTEIPGSVIVLGGGPVGIECAQYLRGFGAEVVLVEAADRLLAREDPKVSALIAESLRAQGIAVHVGAAAKRVRLGAGDAEVDIGPESLRAQRLLVATGRSPNVEGIGLESVGVTPGERGITVDDRCQAGEGVWAVGDVTGVAPFTHVASYQGRVAAGAILGRETITDYSAVPRVVFCDPEVAAVGLTEGQAREEGIPVATATLDLSRSDRTETYGTELIGGIGIVADREREVLVGAWAVGPLASEWIHTAVLAVRAEVPLAVLRDQMAQFPTFSELLPLAVRELS